MKLDYLGVADGIYTPISDKYYICTKDMGCGHYLIGTLHYSENDDDITFVYADDPFFDIGCGDMCSKNATKYKGSVVRKYLLDPFAPPPSEPLHKEICVQCGIESPCHHKWKMMEAVWDWYIKKHIDGNTPLSDGPGNLVYFREVPR